MAFLVEYDFPVFVTRTCTFCWQIRGMAHRSEAADHSIEDMTSVFEVGDRVKAVVLKVSFCCS